VVNDLRLARFELGGTRFAVFSAPVHRGPREPLTPSEAEVRALVLAGLSNRQIALRRGRAVRTIANQVASLFRKLGVSSRAELASLETTG
jgi:DNA-binding NarL/FixJ family response regulator